MKINEEREREKRRNSLRLERKYLHMYRETPTLLTGLTLIESVWCAHFAFSLFRVVTRTLRSTTEFGLHDTDLTNVVQRWEESCEHCCSQVFHHSTDFL